MLIVNSRIRIPLSEFEFTYVRSSGPGGQNVNKVNSKAQLRWNIVESPSLTGDARERILKQLAHRITGSGELLINSQRYRDQGRNVDDCLEKLREMLAVAAVRPKARRPTKPSKGSVRRRLETKKQASQKKNLRRGPGSGEY